jgi:hypothetical protein
MEKEKKLYQIDSEFGPIYIEAEPVSDLDSGKTPLSVHQDVDFVFVNRSFEDAMVNIEAAYKSLQKIMSSLNPDEINLELGVKINLKTGFFVISAGSDVSFKVGLKWKKSPQ